MTERGAHPPSRHRPDDPAEQPVTDLSQLHDAVVSGVPAIHLDTLSDAVPFTSVEHTPAAEVFADRHIGPRGGETAHMLVGRRLRTRLDDLVDAAVPASIRTDRPLDLPAARSEEEVLAALRTIAGRNQVMTQMIGQGYSDTITPAVIRRNVLESPAWYTAYTPYQPEIAQGRLEALLNFQTMVTDLTGLDVANASLLDEATAVAEAVALMWRAARGKAGTVVLDADLFGQSLAVTLGRAEAIGLPVVVADLTDGLPEIEGDLIGVVAAAGRCVGPRPRPARRHRADQGARRAGHGRRRPARPHAAHLPRRARCRRLGRLRPALRRPAVRRRPARRVHGRAHRASSACCPAGSWASRSTPTAPAPTGSRCRRVSSTSAARRRRATSAPRRRCWRSSRRCTRSTTGPTACGRSRERVHAHAAGLAELLTGIGVDGRARHLLRHRPHGRPRQGPRGRRAGRRGGRQPVGARRRPRADRVRRAHQRRPPAADRAGVRRRGRDDARGRRRRHLRVRVLRRRRAATRCPAGPASHQRLPARTRSSTCTAPRPRCCATCAASRTRTWPWTAR